MKLNISNSNLSQISRFIELNFALNYPKERWDILERSILSAAKESGYQDTEKFIRHITSSPVTHENIEILVLNLTVNETYFWREPLVFKALENKIIPELTETYKQNEKRIRVWSAGCSTGEEPYSIAIAIKRAVPDIDNRNISILANDINAKMLQKAFLGVYGQWSFRNSPHWLQEKYFIKNDDGKYEIVPEIKRMVTFKYLNLADGIYPSPLNNTNALDIIFCRNVLMYFSQRHSKKIIKQLYNSLSEGGYLIVSASELSIDNFKDFVPVNIDGMVIYRKLSKKDKKHVTLTFDEAAPEIELTKVPAVKVKHIEKEDVQYPDLDELKPEEQTNREKNISYNEILKLYVQGKYNDVINSIKDHPQTTDTQILLIKAYANLGKFSEALSVCEKSIVTDKLNPALHHLYATILQENNQYNEAITSLKRAVYLDPDFILSYFSLGNIYKRFGEINKSIKSYKNALSILDKYKQDEIIAESEGLTAGRFREIINTIIRTKEIP